MMLHRKDKLLILAPSLELVKISIDMSYSESAKIHSEGRLADCRILALSPTSHVSPQPQFPYL